MPQRCRETLSEDARDPETELSLKHFSATCSWCRDRNAHKPAHTQAPHPFFCAALPSCRHLTFLHIWSTLIMVPRCFSQISIPRSLVLVTVNYTCPLSYCGVRLHSRSVKVVLGQPCFECYCASVCEWGRSCRVPEHAWVSVLYQRINHSNEWVSNFLIYCLYISALSVRTHTTSTSFLSSRTLRVHVATIA